MRQISWLIGTALVSVSGMASAQTNRDMDEVIVTAQKRAENVQDVPIAIQVLNTETLESLAADNIGDIDAFIPGLEVRNGSPTQPRFAIRGILTEDFGVGTDPAVGVYVDGVYAARSGASLLAFNDVERIEVIKGPQGTLLGRNSSAGAVSIITKKPSQEFEAELSVSYGNFDKRRVEGLINIPLSETAAVRFNGVINKRDGLYTDAVTGADLKQEDNWALRGALGWDITPKTHLNLTVSHDELDQDARPAIGLVEIRELPDSPPVPTDPSTYLDPRNVDIRNDVIDNGEKRNLDEVVLNITHDFGGIELTSISAWRQFETRNRKDEDGTNSVQTYLDSHNIEDNESIYQEFRLAGDTGKLNWLTGVSYFDETARQTTSTNTNSTTIDTLILNTQNTGGIRLLDTVQTFLNAFNIDANLLGHNWREDMINRGDYKAYAAFADVTYEVTDQLSLTIGGRYTRDEKTFSWFNGPRIADEFDENLAIAAPTIDLLSALSGISFSAADLMGDFVFTLNGLAGVACDNGVTVAEGVECINKDVFEDFSPRIVLDYKLNDNTLIYGSYAQGYKAGGFNSVQVSSRFANEGVDNFELGFKTTIEDLGLRVNGSLFHFKYDDKQIVLLANDVAGSGVPQLLIQTTDEKATGVDLETEWAATKNLGLMANLQYIDMKFGDAVTIDGDDLSGQPTGEPIFGYAVGGRYEVDLDNKGSLEFQAMHSYRGSRRCFDALEEQGRCTGDEYPFKVGRSRERTDVRAYWRSQSQRYQIGVYANNLFDNIYIGNVNNLTTSVLGTPSTTLSNPRYYGVDFKFKY